MRLLPEVLTAQDEVSLAAGDVFLIRESVFSSETISNFAAFVYGVDPGAVVDIGLYDLATENLIVSSGPFPAYLANAGDQFPVDKSITPVQLLAGEYVRAITCNSERVRFLGINEPTQVLGLLHAVGFYYGRATNKANSNGSLPSTLGGFGTDVGPLPATAIG